MSVVEIRCPRCGSPCDKEGNESNVYICPHCKTTFHFVDTTKRVVTTEVRVRNCLFCGAPIEKGKGYKCTRCGKEYFCPSCVSEMEHKFVCLYCLKELSEQRPRPSEQPCQFCNSTSVVYYCPTCCKYVCSDCAKRIFIRARCPKCNNRLEPCVPLR